MKRKETLSLTVDEEFENLIPSPSEDEYNQLRDNILEYGEVRDPICVWQIVEKDGTNANIIVDGHTRWKILQEICDSFDGRGCEWIGRCKDGVKDNRGNDVDEISFYLNLMTFFSRDEVKEWMIRNQLGRRNVPDYVRAELALRLKPQIAAKAKKNLATGKKGLEKSTKAINTREEIASIANVSSNTIAKVEKLAADAPKEVKEDLRKGKVSINKAYNELIKKADSDKTNSDSEIRQRLNEVRQIQTTDALIEEVHLTTMLVRDTLWKNINYNKHLCKSKKARQHIRGELIALDESIKRMIDSMRGAQ